MTFTPYPSQVDDLATLRANDYTGPLFIEAGGGKTALACLVMRELNPEVTLIIAPRSTLRNEKKNWPKNVRDIVGGEVRVMGNGNKKQKAALTAFEFGVPGVYAATTQWFGRKSTDISNWTGDLLIVDEIHQLSTPKSSAQRRLSGFYPGDDPISLRFSHRLGLSGTPLRQNFVNAWATMRFLWPDRSGYGDIACDNHWAWASERMNSKEIPLEWEWIPTSKTPAPEGARINPNIEGRECWMKVTKKATNFLGETEEGLLVSQMPCAIIHKRRVKPGETPCCKHHPEGFLPTEEPQVIERTVELLPKQKRAIAELEEHYMTYLDDNPLVTKLSITQQQRIRQICLGEPRVEYWEDDEGEERSRLEFDDDCGSPFTDELISILDNEIPQDEPVVVFLDSQRFASVLTKRLNKAGITAQEYSGKTKADVEEFGSEYRVLVAQVTSIGTGTDGLQDNCVNEVWLEQPISITSETQGQARLDRIGAKGQIQRWVLLDELGYARGRMSENLEKKLKMNRSMTRKVA